MSAILRVDDFPGTKPNEFNKHNLSNFKKFDEVLAKNGVKKYVLGVIPKYTTKEDVDYLASNPRVEVALHGIDHDERFPNEFREHETTDSIYRKVIDACKILGKANANGIISSYIPPHNVIDLKTIRALESANFRNILCGPGSESSAMDFAKEIGLNVLYSHHPTYYGRSDEMMNRDNSVPAILNDYDGVVTLHWTWEFNIGLDSLDKMMNQIGHVFV